MEGRDDSSYNNIEREVFFCFFCGYGIVIILCFDNVGGKK